jgi:nucleotide-binding universal stress UspA family protein
MIPGLESILVVLEPELGSGALLEKAARIAAGAGARLRLFCAGHDPRLTARLILSPDSLSAARADFLRRRLEWLGTLAAPLTARGLEVETEAAWDAPSHAAILTEVGLARPGLVMKDAAWHATLTQRLFSHADWRLMQACPVPVLLTRQSGWASPPRVAAAVDPGHPGDPADLLDHAILGMAERLAAWIGARPEVVHAYLPLDRPLLAAAGGMPLAPPEGSVGDDMRRAAAAAVTALLAGHRLPPGAATFLEGAAVDVLPAWCAERGVDVLVVGVASRSRLAGAVIGSTAERMLERVPSDLLAVRGPPP